MPRRIVRDREQAERPLLDLVSFGRGGRHATGSRLTLAEVDQIRRTANRTPEAVVKVLSRGSSDLSAAGKHLDYISRHGKLDLEADDRACLSGGVGRELLEDWDLDIDDVRRQTNLSAARGRKAPKLIHKLMFSMPPGTPPEKVLAAVRNLAREQFALQHRYAFVLHTDEPHPHVHLVLKAVSEHGVRLNIKKATLRHWRSEFARNLRQLGVPANATERAVRGEGHKSKKDGMYRASLRGDSTYIRAHAESVAIELMSGSIRADSGKAKLLETRRAVERGWHSLSSALMSQGEGDLAEDVAAFARQLPPVRTDREQVAAALLEGVLEQRTRDRSPSR